MISFSFSFSFRFWFQINFLQSLWLFNGVSCFSVDCFATEPPGNKDMGECTRVVGRGPCGGAAGPTAGQPGKPPWPGGGGIPCHDGGTMVRRVRRFMRADAAPPREWTTWKTSLSNLSEITAGKQNVGEALFCIIRSRLMSTIKQADCEDVDLTKKGSSRLLCLKMRNEEATR